MNQIQTPPLTREILHQLGLAIEQGTDEAQQRATFGNATVDWLIEAEKSANSMLVIAEIVAAVHRTDHDAPGEDKPFSGADFVEAVHDILARNKLI